MQINGQSSPNQCMQMEEWVGIVYRADPRSKANTMQSNGQSSPNQCVPITPTPQVEGMPRI